MITSPIANAQKPRSTMTLEEALELVEQVLDKGHLNKVQELVFCESWQGQSYEDIAKASSYDPGYVKDVGSKLWQSLSLALGEKVTKHSVEKVLKRVAKQRNQPIEQQNHCVPATITQQDWGEAIDVSIFYGRNQELALLEQWLLHDRCRLVAILGMGGMGKTSLSVKLAEQVQHQFKFLFWRSLSYAPPFEELVTELVRFLSNHQEPQLPETVEGKTARLLHYLRSSRCLVILDNFESILQGNSQTGQYRKDYEGYGYLLKSLAEVRHQSCVILTSREKPKEVGLFEGVSSPVRSLQLQGLTPVEGQYIFKDKGCFSSDRQEWLEIFEHYAGNPLALKMVASGVQELFDGDVAELLPNLRQGKLRFADINELLGRQFERLSEAEQQVLYWLAVNREPVSLPELEADVVSETITKQLLGALRSLTQRSLLERSDKRWLLQPVVMEYATAQLVNTIYKDIIDQQPEFLRNYALIKAQSKDYIRQAQIRFILQPVIDKLLLSLGSYTKIQQQLEAIVSKLRADAPLQPGYVGGNILNLLVQMQIDLRGFDFSYLTICQAYLQEANLYEVNFAHCHFSKSVFAQSFGGVLAIAFSPDGQFLATGNANCEIHLWRVSDCPRGSAKGDRQRLLTLQGHRGWVRKIAFSPDGQILASSSEDGTIKLWNLPSGEYQSTLCESTESVYGVTFSPDGRLLANGSNDGTIRIWNAVKGDCLQVLKGHTNGVLSVDFSPDGKHLASCGFDNTIRVWDWQTGACLQTITAHHHWVGSVQFSPDGKRLVSASCDRTIRIWRVSDGKCLGVFKGHTQWVWKAFWSPDGRRVASCGEDQTIRIWDVETRSCLHTLQGHSSRVWGISFSPDGQTLASCSEDQTIRLWQVSNGQCIANIQGYTNWVKTVAFSPDSQTIATGHKDRTLRIWDVNSGKCLREFKAHTKGIPAVAFHPNGEILATGSEDTTIKVWNLSEGECIHVLKEHTNEIWSLNFSPDGTTLASSSFDHTIKLWEVSTGDCLQTLEGHCDRVGAVSYSPQGTILASGSEDNTIKLWDTRRGECIQTLKGHLTRVGAIAFNPNSQLLASASSDHTLKIWDVTAGKCIRTLEGHTGWVMSVAFYPDGRKIASGSCDQTVKIWDSFEGTCLNTLTGHTNWIWSIALSPDGRKLASASEDETIRIWSMQTQTCLAILKAKRPYECMRLEGATGLTPAQRTMLTILGAVEECSM
ncbi:MAG: NB-ARC domain-containing protein [Cyanobacteriota bacterium]